MKILYVEDLPNQRDIMRQRLELLGYDVVLASRGEEGIEMAHQEQPDVILMDLRMPGMGGFDAIKHLKSDPDVSNIPVIALSLWTSRSSREDALRAGAAIFLSKDVKLERLIKEIDSLGYQSNEKSE